MPKQFKKRGKGRNGEGKRIPNAKPSPISLKEIIPMMIFLVLIVLVLALVPTFNVEYFYREDIDLEQLDNILNKPAQPEP